MKKFLVGFGGLLILLGVGGLINHISMALKAVETEREIYGGSIQFMLLQLVSSLGPYFTTLIGGGIIIALAAFLNEYQKRNELTSELIKALSSKPPLEESSNSHPQPQQAEHIKTNKVAPYEPNQKERLYWNG